MDRGKMTLAGAALVLALIPGATQAQDGGSTGVAAWDASVLAPLSGDARVVGVAVGSELMVAVGQRACGRMTDRGARCWGQAWVSPDGITWTASDPRTSGLELGRLRPALSGPAVGLQGVADGPAGFLAFGRVGLEGGMEQRSAVWRSEDGLSWERLSDAGTFPRGTRLRTILATEDGYLLGGVVYRARAPRAAIWSSPDGETWTAGHGTRDDRTFEIGGYIDTLEDPASGGVNAFAPYPGAGEGQVRTADGVVAVGLACMPSFDRDPWAWNGACWGQLWRSLDGLTWRKDEGARPRPYGAIRHADSVAERLVIEAQICLEDCPSAVLLTDDGDSWRVAYGSPVDGELKALASQSGRFRALLAAEDGSEDGSAATLALWTSGDGTNWALEESQPALPVTFSSLADVDMAVAGDRLVVTASGEAAPDGDVVSVALLSPPLP